MLAKYYLKMAGLGLDAQKRIEALGFWRAPASKGHHLAKIGGLAEHSIGVTDRLVALTESQKIEWSRPESPYLVGMLHDLVKCKCYRPNPDGKTFSYNQPEWPGHGVASYMVATAELGILLYPDEAAAIIHHMGAFGLQGQAMTEFNAAIDKWPGQIIVTHMADWMASRLDEDR
jgi:hypothetical protein